MQAEAIVTGCALISVLRCAVILGQLARAGRVLVQGRLRGFDYYYYPLPPIRQDPALRYRLAVRAHPEIGTALGSRG